MVSVTNAVQSTYWHSRNPFPIVGATCLKTWLARIWLARITVHLSLGELHVQAHFFSCSIHKTCINTLPLFHVYRHDCYAVCRPWFMYFDILIHNILYISQLFCLTYHIKLINSLKHDFRISSYKHAYPSWPHILSPYACNRATIDSDTLSIFFHN
jgi:hypothetical protein